MPRFTVCLDLPGLISFPRIFHSYSKSSMYRASIYRASRFTVAFCFPPRGPVNRGSTVLLISCYACFKFNRVVSPLPICVHIPCFLPSPKVKFTLKYSQSLHPYLPCTPLYNYIINVICKIGFKCYKMTNVL